MGVFTNATGQFGIRTIWHIIIQFEDNSLPNNSVPAYSLPGTSLQGQFRIEHFGSSEFDLGEFGGCGMHWLHLCRGVRPPP